MKELLAAGLYIGVSGCSLKTKENMQVIKEIPLDRVLIESASPHCDIRPAYASYNMVKTRFPIKKFTQYNPEDKAQLEKDTLTKFRNEPCTIIQIIEVLSSLKSIPIITICKATYENSVKLFKLNVKIKKVKKAPICKKKLSK